MNFHTSTNLWGGKLRVSLAPVASVNLTTRSHGLLAAFNILMQPFTLVLLLTNGSRTSGMISKSDSLKRIAVAVISMNDKSI